MRGRTHITAARVARLTLVVGLGLVAIQACGPVEERRARTASSASTQVAESAAASAKGPIPVAPAQRVGDLSTNYVNPEFSDDGRYLVWLEGTRMLADGRMAGWLWHCGVNAETGELDPPDGKGFRAFESSIGGRANPGKDSRGIYYIGVDVDGRFVFVRPTGPRAGQVTVLPTPADPERRAVYPTSLDSREGGYVYWLKSHGSFFPGRAEWVELNYMDISHPDRTVAVERQPQRPFRWTPLDVVFSYWFPGTSQLIYGVQDANGHLQVKEVDASGRSPQRLLTNDPVDHINPKPFIFNGKRYLFSGIDRIDKSIVYVEDAPGQPFTPFETIVVPNSTLKKPCLAQSHEPFEFDGRLYSVFQLSDCGGRTRSFFIETGEIWLAEIGGSRRLWRLSHDGDDVKNEPEPIVGKTRAWIFYTTYPRGISPLKVRQELWRVQVPVTAER